jgi:alkanesulfonate monooxygenase SsuD/methylene tetrahydromethanopterin reductase-like flavin-dependent oxidoreductase (luciferase family)
VEIGVPIPHTGRQASPNLVAEWCALAEQTGFSSVWGVDHVVMPQRVVSKYLLSREPASIGEDDISHLMSPNFELVTTMAFVAALTTRVKIGSSVTVHRRAQRDRDGPSGSTWRWMDHSGNVARAAFRTPAQTARHVR